MNESPITQIKNNLNQLRQLIDNLGTTVNNQQQTLITSRAELFKPAVQQSSDEVGRLLIHVRRTLEDLERRVKAQEKEQEQLKALQDISAAVNSSLNLDEVLIEVMDSIIALTKAERSILLLRNEETDELENTLYRNIDRETVDKQSFQISRSIVQSVAETGEPIATMNAQSDPRFAAQESIISYNLRSILCAPLKIKGKVIGVIYTDNRVAAGIFNDTDRDMLSAFANQAAVAIENARLFQQIQSQLDEITEMRDLMNNVFESIASGVITINEKDRIALVNRAASDILSATPDEIIQQSLNEAEEMLQLPFDSLVGDVK
ncbi:MAG: GAF domain-containing protein, partial [Chloroflexota bacterium]